MTNSEREGGESRDREKGGEGGKGKAPHTTRKGVHEKRGEFPPIRTSAGRGGRKVQEREGKREEGERERFYHLMTQKVKKKIERRPERKEREKEEKRHLPLNPSQGGEKKGKCQRKWNIKQGEKGEGTAAQRLFLFPSW